MVARACMCFVWGDENTKIVAVFMLADMLTYAHMQLSIKTPIRRVGVEPCLRRTGMLMYSYV